MYCTGGLVVPCYFQHYFLVAFKPHILLNERPCHMVTTAYCAFHAGLFSQVRMLESMLCSNRHLKREPVACSFAVWVFPLGSDFFLFFSPVCFA